MLRRLMLVTLLAAACKPNLGSDTQSVSSADGREATALVPAREDLGNLALAPLSYVWVTCRGAKSDERADFLARLGGRNSLALRFDQNQLKVSGATGNHTAVKGCEVLSRGRLSAEEVSQILAVPATDAATYRRQQLLWLALRGPGQGEAAIGPALMRLLVEAAGVRPAALSFKALAPVVKFDSLYNPCDSLKVPAGFDKTAAFSCGANGRFVPTAGFAAVVAEIQAGSFGLTVPKADGKAPRGFAGRLGLGRYLAKRAVAPKAKTERLVAPPRAFKTHRFLRRAIQAERGKSFGLFEIDCDPAVGGPNGEQCPELLGITAESLETSAGDYSDDWLEPEAAAEPAAAVAEDTPAEEPEEIAPEVLAEASEAPAEDPTPEAFEPTVEYLDDQGDLAFADESGAYGVVDQETGDVSTFDYGTTEDGAEVALADDGALWTENPVQGGFDVDPDYGTEDLTAVQEDVAEPEAVEDTYEDLFGEALADGVQETVRVDEAGELIADAAAAECEGEEAEFGLLDLPKTTDGSVNRCAGNKPLSFKDTSDRISRGWTGFNSNGSPTKGINYCQDPGAGENHFDCDDYAYLFQKFSQAKQLPTAQLDVYQTNADPKRNGYHRLNVVEIASQTPGNSRYCIHEPQHSGGLQEGNCWEQRKGTAFEIPAAQKQRTGIVSVRGIHGTNFQEVGAGEPSFLKCASGTKQCLPNGQYNQSVIQDIKKRTGIDIKTEGGQAVWTFPAQQPAGNVSRPKPTQNASQEARQRAFQARIDSALGKKPAATKPVATKPSAPKRARAYYWD